MGHVKSIHFLQRLSREKCQEVYWGEELWIYENNVLCKHHEAKYYKYLSLFYKSDR